MPLCWVFSFVSLILILMVLGVVYGGPLSMEMQGNGRTSLLMKWFW